MKLLSKYNRINLFVTIIVFILGSSFFFLILRYILINQLDETLLSEQQEIVKYVDVHNNLPEIVNTSQQWTYYNIVKEPIKSAFFHNSSFINDDNKIEPVRQLVFPLQIKGRNYTIIINKSERESQNLLSIIIVATIGMIGVILLANFIVNQKVLSRLWTPFYKTVENIKQYRLSDKHPLKLEEVPIDEFNSLNESLNEMSDRIYSDYESLKRFTENASHEMQTPLAVIRSKTEVLLQSAEWRERDLQQLQQIEDATQRLAKLHQSLLLLTKLENRQFGLTESIELSSIVRQKLNERKEVIDAKNISILADLHELTVLFHQHLAEILISNLLNNAIRHTHFGGTIEIKLGGNTLSIANSGGNGELNKDKIFQRFYKTSDSTEGTGLGLAIVKEICNLTNSQIRYSYEDKKHRFIIHFANENIR